MTEKCEVRIDNQLESTIDDLRKLWSQYCKDPESYDDELGNMDEYGLCFDYVAPQTFDDQNEGYFRYQLSYGGPSSEFRIYADKVSDYWEWSVYRIEFWFLDWFDGASRELHGENLKLMEEIFESFFVASESATHQYNQAIE